MHHVIPFLYLPFSVNLDERDLFTNLPVSSFQTRQRRLSKGLSARRYFDTTPNGKPFHVDVPQLTPPTTPTRSTRQAPAPLPTPSPEPPVIHRDNGSVTSRKPSVTRYVDSPATRELNATLAAPDAQIAETNARLGIKPKVTPAASTSPSPGATIQPIPPPTPRPASSTMVAATNAPASGPVTRSRPLPTPSKPPLTQHTFAPYVKVRPLFQIDTDIRSLLLTGLDPKDTGRSGWVYGFRFPAAHTITALPKPHSAHDSPDAVARRPAAYVKIGYTGNPGQRMDSIAEQCGYAPQLQFMASKRKSTTKSLIEGKGHKKYDYRATKPTTDKHSHRAAFLYGCHICSCPRPLHKFPIQLSPQDDNSTSSPDSPAEKGALLDELNRVTEETQILRYELPDDRPVFATWKDLDEWQWAHFSTCTAFACSGFGRASGRQ